MTDRKALNDPKPPSRWDAYLGYFWAFALVAVITGLEYMALMGVQP